MPFKTNMKFAKCFLVFFVLCILRNAKSAPNGKDKESTAAASRKELLYPVDDVKDRVQFTDADKNFAERPLSLNLTFFRHRFHPKSNLRIFPFGAILIVQPEGPHDGQIIGAFVASQNISAVKGSGVFARVLKLEDDSKDELSRRLRSDFRQGMVGSSVFNPTHALIVTWRNMTIDTSYFDKKKTKDTNTYQLVLATDGQERTFLMLNYEHLERVPEKFAKEVFVGFTSEYNRTYSYPTYSQSPQITRLATTGYGNGLPGRHYFQVDDPIFQGTCLEKRYDTLNESHHFPLTFFPRRGNMLGGHEINVTGPCFQPQSKIVCRFGKLATVPGIYRDINHATCIAPFLSHHGYIELSVSVGGNNLTNFTGNYYVESPEFAEEDVRIEDEQARNSYPHNITIRWNARKIPTTSRAVRLALWGVTRESGRLRLKYIDEISSRAIPRHIDELKINVRQEFANRWNPGTQNLTFGFLSVNFSSEGLVKSNRTLWSRPMPLAWYFMPQWKKMYADEVNDTFCKLWANEERTLPPVNATLPPCPCTLREAEINIAHFMPHDKCNPVERRCDGAHRLAHQCFESATTSRAGSSQTCCYDHEGELIRSADTLYSGRVERASPFGKEPFNGVNNVPGLSIWYRDTMPYFFCAEWSADKDSESVQTYEKLRPSKDCTSYKPPTVGSVFGDPHFKTFNGLTYTFNGLGEFVLVRDERPFENLDIQGRFVQVQSRNLRDERIRASYLSAVVARSNKSATVEFRLRPYSASSRFQMDIIVDKNYVTFYKQPRPFLYFKGVTLHVPLGIHNLSTVIATFDTGVGIRVQVAGRENLAVNVVLDQSYKNHTKGLLGNYGKEDFTLPDGSVALLSTANARDIHDKFAQKWRLTERHQKNIGSSLFYHDILSWSHYNYVNFTPIIFDTTPYDIPQVITNLCGDSFPCVYDFVVTKNRTTAANTLFQHRNAETLFRHSRNAVVRCPALPRPAHGRKSVVSYYIGTTVEFDCDPGYTLHGTAIRVCRDTGAWTSGIPVVCKRNN